MPVKAPEAPHQIDESLYDYVPEDETFRNRIATLDDQGRRKWVFAKMVKGRFMRWRGYVALALLGFFFIAPFISVGGQPLLLLNFPERRFVLFGKPFWPQDFYILVFVALTAILGLAAFTIAFGRIFCGWICPQTIFQEFVFRKIEYWTDGDAPAQRALSQEGWTPRKLRKRILKHSLFATYSLIMGHWFLMYIIGYQAVIDWVGESPLSHPGALGGMLAFSGAYYLVFARLREQVCTVACPYGRLQGVLLDMNSIVISYDHRRGEPRGKLRKGETRTQGDCIDCYQCVQVCPTGIDIRNGTQLECINCTACIDACDSIMDRIGKPRGLIRYASQDAVTRGLPFRFTGRMAVYGLVVTALLGVFTVLIVTRKELHGTVLRMPGTLFQQQPDGSFTNLYQLDLVNKSTENKTVMLRLAGTSGTIRMNSGSDTAQVAAQEARRAIVVVNLPAGAVSARETPIHVELVVNGQVADRVKTNFLGPLRFGTP